jgi:hypothetical protein
MNYAKTDEKLADYSGQIAELRKKMRNLHAEVEPKEVKDYGFAMAEGSCSATRTRCSSCTTRARGVPIACCGRTGFQGAEFAEDMGYGVASRCSSIGARSSCAYPITRSRPATTSALSGTSSISFPKGAGDWRPKYKYAS